MTDPEIGHHRDGDRPRPFLLWRLPEPARVVSSAPLGGGLGLRHWVLNAQVDVDYARTDPDAHLAALADEAGARGDGVGMMTAADLTPGEAEEDGVRAWATVGVTAPTWAADEDDAVSRPLVGTINIVVAVPVAVTDAALVNLALTATEAKAQALFETGVPGTGTASDAVCVLSPTAGAPEPFGGPRSPWGARVARTVHAAVRARR